MKGGLAKIEEANVQLEELNAQLVVQKVIVAEQTKECEILLKEITKGIYCVLKPFDDAMHNKLLNRI